MFKHLNWAVVACHVAGLAWIAQPAWAELLAKPAVQTQLWTGFDEPTNAYWQIQTTAIAPRTAPTDTPAVDLVLPIVGYVPDFSDYIGTYITTYSPNTTTSSDLVVYMHPYPTYRAAPKMVLPDAIHIRSVSRTISAASKAVIRRQDEKFTAVMSDSNSNELALGSQVLTANGTLLNLATSYASFKKSTDNDSFNITGRISVGDVIRKQQRKASTTVGRSNVLFNATYEVDRTVTFDLDGTLAAYRDANLLVRIIDADTNQNLFTIRQPASGREKAFSLTGTLDPGRYLITAKAVTKLKRDRGSTVARGGAGQFEVNFQTDDSISTQQIMEAARLGVTPLDEVMQMFDLDDEEMIYLVGEGKLATSYLNQYTGMSDLELITQAISQSQRAHHGLYWSSSSLPSFDAPVLRRALDVLPDFVVFNADNELVYDSALAKTFKSQLFTDLGSIVLDDGTADDDTLLSPYDLGWYYDEFGDYLDHQIAWGAGYSVSLLEPQFDNLAMTMTLIPEPATAMLICAGAVMFLRSRRSY